MALAGCAANCTLGVEQENLTALPEPTAGTLAKPPDFSVVAIASFRHFAAARQLGRFQSEAKVSWW
jgi:hypothetical protein